LFSSTASVGVEQARRALSRLLDTAVEPSERPGEQATEEPRPKVESHPRLGAANQQKKTPG
jgi:hypothetical protein